ncbi:MAG: tetratricopeptide repeat protein, partial [Isosphaerales bacterium]
MTSFIPVSRSLCDFLRAGRGLGTCSRAPARAGRPRLPHQRISRDGADHNHCRTKSATGASDSIVSRLAAPASDVYSLDATLYNLLTGKSAFDGTDVTTVLSQVQEGTFASPRTLEPRIDRALEAVCLKAMANKPENRYASCRELAADIERWAADEPVSAWREPFGRRVRRWGKQNRTMVTAAAVALLASVVGLAAVLIVQTQAKADLSRSLSRETSANMALAEANAELARSKDAVQARYDLAVAAVRTFHTGVSEDFLLKQDQFKELRDRLLKSASDFYGKLGALLGRESDPASRLALARANFEGAALTRLVGRTEEALAAHRKVLAAREALASEAASGDEAIADVGHSLAAIGRLLELTGKPNEAETAYREVELRLARPAGPAPSAAVRTALANCRSRLGWLLIQTGHTAQGLSKLRLARADQVALVGSAAATDLTANDLAISHNNLGNLLSEADKASEAEAEYRTALAIQQKLASDHPSVTKFRGALAQCHNNLGILQSEAGKAREAEAEHRSALAIWQKLADDNPAVTSYRGELANATVGLATAHLALGHGAVARTAAEQAVVLLKALLEHDHAFSGALCWVRHCSAGARRPGPGATPRARQPTGTARWRPF